MTCYTLNGSIRFLPESNTFESRVKSTLPKPCLKIFNSVNNKYNTIPNKGASTILSIESIKTNITTSSSSSKADFIFIK